MNYQALLAGQSIAIENALKLTDNFAIENFPSPNPKKTQIENVKLWNTNDEYDGYKVYQEQVAINGINNPIPLEITDLSTGEKIYNGFALPYDSNALLKQDGEGNSIVLPLVEEETDFDKICESVHLRRFISPPYTYTAWSSTVNYSVLVQSYVSYKNNIYLNFTNNRNVAPDSVNGLKNWLLVGSVPYPSAFTTADYETIFCVVEQPDSPQDAAYWGGNILTILTLVISLIDIANDYATAAGLINPVSSGIVIAGATLKLVTIIFFVYELISAFVIPIRKYYAIKVRKLLEKAFNYLGYRLKSSILNSPEFDNLVYIAATDQEAVISGNPKNIPIPNKNLREFMLIFSQMFNAKFKPMANINNNSKQIYFENISFFWQPVNPETGRENGFIIPNMQNNGTIQISNYDELHENYSLSFADDSLDMGNHKNSTSKSMAVIFTEPNNTHKSIKALQGSEEIILPVSLAAAKGGDSFFQKLFNTIYDALSFLIGNVDRGGDRRGMLLTPNNNIGTDKIFISDGRNLIARNNTQVINAANIYTRFHKNRTIKGGFQFKRITQKGNFVQQPRFVKELFYWNVCKDENGRVCIVTKFSRNVQTGLIEIEYRYQEDFSNREQISERISVG
jgi:hypothetical protein